jgi:tetratricopeptide (TPR) repeat protein
MLNPFRKKAPAIHEPISLQIADVKKLDPLIVDIILKGSDCDSLPNAKGPFGSISNPIPVNGSIGEIKYLCKLRGRTGFATFFHRIGSVKCLATEKPVDKFEIVCHDSTQWTYLYFDLYHPRRSNLCPEGFKLVPFNEQLKMDIPFAYGVDFFVSDFPYGLPDILEKSYGKAFSRRAKEWLGEYRFENPFEKNSDQNNDKNRGPVKENEGRTSSNSPAEIKHYSFMSGVINEILALEKNLITVEKTTKLNNFSCLDLYDNKAHVRFMIERYLYLSALLKYHKQSIDLSEMNKYVTIISMEEYKQSNVDTLIFFKERIELYYIELEMLKKLEHPHPGKIAWCLYHPSNTKVSNDTNSMFESNFIASVYLLEIINETFKKEYLAYSNQAQMSFVNNPATNEALSQYENGIVLMKKGDYEEALDSFFKAKSINNNIEGLTAYILISKFWDAEFEIEDEYETLFVSFSNEIKKNPKLIELFEARAWLSYNILNNVEDLDESKYVFYKTQSESDFSVCISLDPNNNKYYGSRSLLFRCTKEFSKALQDINKAIDLAPESSRHYKDRADIYQNIGRLADCLNDIDTAISLCKEERWLLEYKNLKENLKALLKESKTKREIKSRFETISKSTQLQQDEIIMMYERDATHGNAVTAYQILKIDQFNVRVKKMAINGEPLKVEQRLVTNFKFEDFVNNKSSLLIDETNDKDGWPKTLPDAIKQLLEIYDDASLNHISQMSWSEFQMEYFMIGGLDLWVRNNFGLWRGNYDLLLDSKIDKIDPDNASVSILYHFWEYVVDNIKPK